MSIAPPISSVEPPVAVWSQTDAANAKISLIGMINVYSLGGVWTQIRDAQDAWLKQGTSQTLVLDATRISSLDGAGIAFLIGLQEAQQNTGGKFEIIGLDSRYQPLLNEFYPISNLFPAPELKPKRSFIVSTGMAAQNLIDDARGLITFTGHLSADLVWSIRNIKQVRWGDFVNAAVEAGINALPIVGLVAFLIGVILSFQAAIGMKQFGAESFVGPLAALGIVREMGPLITAILLAGRSSAAFAAEIGTMTVNSEVDALVSGGLSPIRFLVVPRVLAGILVMPILTLYADIISIIGTGAAAVGMSATRAVVSSIVMIVVVDGVFAFISYKTGFWWTRLITIPPMLPMP